MGGRSRCRKDCLSEGGNEGIEYRCCYGAGEEGYVKEIFAFDHCFRILCFDEIVQSVLGTEVLMLIACWVRRSTGMPALHEIPAPVTMTERFDFDICVDNVERRIRCSGVGFSIEIWTVIFNQKRCLTELSQKQGLSVFFPLNSSARS